MVTKMTHLLLVGRCLGVRACFNNSVIINVVPVSNLGACEFCSSELMARFSFMIARRVMAV